MRVESSHFPYLPVTLSLHGHRLEFEALLDTGFDGGLAVPEGTIAIGLSAAWKIRAYLADGSLVHAPAFRGTVCIGSLPPVTATIIILGNAPVLGRAVADHHKITLDRGRRIVVES